MYPKSRIRSALRAAWLLLALLATQAPFASAASNASAKSADPKEQARYARDIEQMWKSIELSPIKFDKPLLQPGDVVKPVCEVTNNTSASVTVPPPPGSQSGAIGYSVAGIEWTLRRLDGKALDSPGPGYGAAAVDAKSFCLFRGSITQQGLFAPGQSVRVPVWDVDVTKHNLASGKYELAVNCFVPDAGYKKVIAKKAVVFEVDNPSAKTPEEIKREAAELAARRKAVSKSIQGALKLGELLLSNTSVSRGTTFNVQLKLSNVSKADVVIPVDTMGKEPFTQQWYLTKVPFSGPRDPSGGHIFAVGTPDPSGNLVIAAGEVRDIENSQATDDLEPGTYEVAVEITDASGASLGLRKQKFRVTK